MKKKIFIILIFLTFSQAEISAISFNNLKENLKNFFDKKILNYIENILGTEDLSLENQEYINDIIKNKLNIQKPIKLKRINNFLTANPGIFHNAFATVNFLTNSDYIFFSEDFFNSLTDEEKQYLIAHEATHVEKNHIKIKISFFLASNFLTSYLIYKLGKNSKIPYNVGLSCSILLAITNLLLNKYLSRKCEYQADSVAVLKLKNSEGGIKLIKRWQELFKPQENCIKELFLTHPDNENRIKNMQNLKKEFNK